MTIKITPLANETRLRNIHSTKGTIISSHNAGAVVLGDEVWIAGIDATDGSNAKKGDKWLLVKSINGVPTTGWMAIIHNSTAICKIVQTTITPLQNDTKLRTIHSKNGEIISSYKIGAVVSGDEVWTADVNATDGSGTKAGDKWLLVKNIDGDSITGWMAIIHNSAAVCKIIVENTPPSGNSPDVVEILYSDVLCVMSDGTQKTFRLTPRP